MVLTVLSFQILYVYKMEHSIVRSVTITRSLNFHESDCKIISHKRHFAGIFDHLLCSFDIFKRANEIGKWYTIRNVSNYRNELVNVIEACSIRLFCVSS